MPSYFLEHFGEQEIEAPFGRDSDPLYERNAGKHKKKTPMSKFVKMVEQGGKSNNYYMIANNMAGSLSGIKSLFDDIADFGQGYREIKDVSSRT